MKNGLKHNSNFLRMIHAIQLTPSQFCEQQPVQMDSTGFTLDTYAHANTSMQTKAANTVSSFLSGAVR